MEKIRKAAYDMMVLGGRLLIDLKGGNPLLEFMKSRFAKSVAGITLSLAIFASGTLVLGAKPAEAAVTVSQSAKIVQTAQSYMGHVKYRFGTRDASRLIFDCSSFTQFVYQKNGIQLPWGSKAQAQAGTRVSDKAHLVKGDLVMFSVGTPGRINHVGIYIGNGKFISNTPSSGVSITDMNSGYWKNRYITGRHL
jgi:murein DD-endopeptidase / murein LD-carboxypeptidase